MITHDPGKNSQILNVNPEILRYYEKLDYHLNQKMNEIDQKVEALTQLKLSLKKFRDREDKDTFSKFTNGQNHTFQKRHIGHWS